MADKSAIEWTEATWNPIVGCSIVSPGCTNCYAMGEAARQVRCAAGHKRSTHYAGTTKIIKGKPVWTGKVARPPDHILTAPLRWKRGRKIFVNSMGDLFHESIPDEWIDRVFAVMALSPQHTFQVLTKRAKRMRAYFERTGQRAAKIRLTALKEVSIRTEAGLPLPNVWLGVSIERQREYDERKEHLRNTPAAVRFFSMEPLLGPIKADYLGDWVIVGGESGPNARPMYIEWARSLRDQCAAAGVPFFFKQWGEWYDEATVVAPEIRGTKYESQRLVRVGKKRAGRLLDGKEHNQFPKSDLLVRQGGGE